jgi:hypothetical protein
VHCVRGWGGKLPAALADNRIVSAWRDGWWYEETPMENLLRILASGCLQASTRWNRTDQASVSFSAVPLLELVSRRRAVRTNSSERQLFRSLSAPNARENGFAASRFSGDTFCTGG